MARAQAGSGKVTLFQQKTPGGLTYRIPALLYLPSESTFLAFAEERSTPRDEDAKFLVMRRGQKEGMSVQWGPPEPLMTAVLPNRRTMNPCPVFERNSGTVFLFFICVESRVTESQQIRAGRNAARLCYVSSQDGGRTWSPATDLTEQVIGGDLKNWATFAVGPGHGVQLRSGRLVVPAYAYYIHRRLFGYPVSFWIKPHCFTFYSDDGGRSWHRGWILRSVRALECQVAELQGQDNSPVVYCNARSTHGSRVEAFSSDGGDRFEEHFLSKKLFEPPSGCQGSVVTFPAQSEPGRPLSPTESSKAWLIFSHPTSRHKRVDLGIYLNTSPLEEDSWKAPWLLYKGPSAYSDLAVCKERPLLFGCLFECGVQNSYEEIAFQLVTDVELERNTREGAS
ncbi:sialidase-3-like [Varanus komodoensis]|uniref:sialidase-3-like n=1 Tax=Varanus komodoensis TaxID=61221 RepID=UPI001CF782CB|nr:sialidase-3-like [Varanus komodoensis]